MGISFRSGLASISVRTLQGKYTGSLYLNPQQRYLTEDRSQPACRSFAKSVLLLEPQARISILESEQVALYTHSRQELVDANVSVRGACNRSRCAVIMSFRNTPQIPERCSQVINLCFAESEDFRHKLSSCRSVPDGLGVVPPALKLRRFAG